MSLRDAARAACVSHGFKHSWSRYPNLTLNTQTLGFVHFVRKVNHILRKHSGVGVKTLKLDFSDCYDPKASNYLDSWLQIAVTPRLEVRNFKLFVNGFYNDEFSDGRFPYMQKYNFPCSLLSDGSGSSIRYLELECCSFRPTVQLGRFGSLTRLHLSFVRITGDELGSLLSSSVVLEQLILKDFSEVISLKIPGQLRRLSYLHLHGCCSLQQIENKAPNLCSIYLGDIPADRTPQKSFQLGELLQLKDIDMRCYNAAYYARSELPSIAPNLETLTLGSQLEMVNTPMDSNKFLSLKYLSIRICGDSAVNLSPPFDYFSLASFIDASPSLKTFSLWVPRRDMELDSIFEGSSDLRQMPQYHHHNLQSFRVTGFSSARSLVELTCHILENTMSLERVTLNTTSSALKCSDAIYGRCLPMPKDNIVEALKALRAIEMYIEVKVPAKVKLDVIGPCERCHVVEEGLSMSLLG